MTITAKFDSKCTVCQGTVFAGDPVEWEKGKGVTHIACVGQEPEAPKAEKPEAPKAPVADAPLYSARVELKGWLAREKGCPKLMEGVVLRETARAVYFRGSGYFNGDTCCECGRPLTNPLSVALGIGPKCGGTYATPPKLEDLTPELVEAYRAKVVQSSTIETWLPKSKTDIEVLTEAGA